jgi:hypothetical protein
MANKRGAQMNALIILIGIAVLLALGLAVWLVIRAVNK